MLKSEIKEWLKNHSYKEKEKSHFYRGKESCECRFIMGKTRLYYQACINGKWVFSYDALYKKISLNDQGALRGLECGLFGD